MTAAIEPMPGSAVAHWRHTLILCAILLGIAAAGFAASTLGPGGTPPPSAPPQSIGLMLYPLLILAEYGLFRVIRRGIRKRGVRVIDLVSARPLTIRAVAFDVILGVGLFCTCIAALTLLHGPSAGTPPMVQRMLVHSAVEIPLWILVSLAAGFVEELVFRGYLQRQFASRLGAVGGIAVQALLFGAVHGYQGWEPLLGITMLGLIFGLMAWGRRSLVPGMIAHAAIDVVGGLQLLQ